VPSTVTPIEQPSRGSWCARRFAFASAIGMSRAATTSSTGSRGGFANATSMPTGAHACTAGVLARASHASTIAAPRLCETTATRA